MNRSYPNRSFPQEPAIGICAEFEVFGICRVVAAAEVCSVHEDGIGLGEGQIAISRSWHGLVRIDLGEGFALLLGFEVVDMVELVWDMHEIEPGQHLAAVDGAGIEVYLKV